MWALGHAISAWRGSWVSRGVVRGRAAVGGAVRWFAADVASRTDGAVLLRAWRAKGAVGDVIRVGVVVRFGRVKVRGGVRRGSEGLADRAMWGGIAEGGVGDGRSQRLGVRMGVRN